MLLLPLLILLLLLMVPMLLEFRHLSRLPMSPLM